MKGAFGNEGALPLSQRYASRRWRMLWIPTTKTTSETV
jgi:hypothetical protein